MSNVGSPLSLFVVWLLIVPITECDYDIDSIIKRAKGDNNTKET